MQCANASSLFVNGKPVLISVTSNVLQSQNRCSNRKRGHAQRWWSREC
eukprot:IDg2703t1